MNRKHLAALETRITAVNWAGPLQIRSSLDGTVVNDGVERYRKLNSRHLEPVRCGLSGGSIPFLLVRTNQSLLHVAQAARTRLFTRDGERDASRRIDTAPGYIAEDLFVEMARGDTVSVEKVIGLHTSRDPAISESVRTPARMPGRPRGSKRCWRVTSSRGGTCGSAATWKLGADERTRMVLRLHLFHLLQVASPNTVDLDVGIPARGWHGEAYRGHIFWDELFILPLLNLRFPEVARARLLYRFRRLEGARRNAAEGAGLRGALYPWQSGSDGREETQMLRLNPRSGHWLPDHSRLQLHVNAAIAYNIWQYFAMTGDRAFLRSFGAEVIFEIARMLAAPYFLLHEREPLRDPRGRGPRRISRGIPRRPEPGLQNNAYTNVMTAWVLRTALRVMEIVLGPEALRELREKIRLEDREVKLWRVIP